jgi:aldehyde:ferredoxin oxidoreductase
LYDGQLRDKIGINPDELTTEEKIAALRQYRYEQYELLLDAVYKRRGWNANSIPTVEKLKEMKMDLPEVVAVVESAMK